MTPKKKSELHISWMTISYRSVAILITTLALSVLVGIYIAFPDSAPVKAVMNLRTKILAKLGVVADGLVDSEADSSQQAHFTNLDGTVKVKKANSNSWVNADYSLPLEKGDIVQTGSEGMAKVVFADGTNYTIKQDSLIVVEENSGNGGQQTQVAVQVTTGTVDLATARYVQGSNSRVIMAGATASLAPESAAMVHNDPRTDRHEILVKKGSGQVTRNNESVMIGEYERLSFRKDSPQMSRQKEIAPPTLITPAQMMPQYVGASAARAIEFSWSQVTSSHGYRVRISRTPYFTSPVFDRVVQETQIKIPGLKEGTYHWQVSSIDIDGRESVESERNQFTVVTRAPDSKSLALELQPFIQHGRVVEVRGKTEPNARVVVNGQEVPLVNADGTFHFFTPSLPIGVNMINVTVQNAKGAVKTEPRKVVIE